MAGQLIWQPGSFLVQQYTGPCLKLADRIVDVDVWRGPIALCRSGTLLRGTYGTSARAGWVVTSSEVNWEQKGIGRLTINWEVGGPYASSAYLPLDDWREEAVELYPKVERNKHMYGTSYPGNANDRISSAVIALAYATVHAATPPARQLAQTSLLSATAPSGITIPSGTSWADQSAWGLVLADWLGHGHETYYLAGLKYSYIRHYFTLPSITMGGLIQSPLWGPLAGDTTLSWLRLADAREPVGVNGSVYKVTSTWLGGPNGHWDSILYAP